MAWWGSTRFSIALLAACMLLVACARTPAERYNRYLQKGQRLLDGNEPTKAILEFRNAIREQPKSPEGYFWIAQALLRTNQIKQAIGALNRAIEIKPGYAAAQLKLAELMIRSRDEDLLRDAEARIQRILVTDPDHEDALFTLAASQAQAGRVEDAEKYLKEALKKSPGNLRSTIALALVKVSQRDLPAAEEILKNAVRQSPDSLDALVALATLLSAMDRFSEAEPLFTKAIGVNSDSTDALIGLGTVQLKIGKKKLADETFRRAARAPNSSAPLAHVVFLIRENRRPEAIGELEEMVRTNPQNRVARTALVAAYLAANRRADAEAILKTTLEKNPRDVHALLQRGQLNLRGQRFDDALANFDKALSIESELAQGHYLRSKVFWAKGDDLKRKQELVLGLKFAPDSMNVRFDLADAQLRAHNPKEALQTLNEAPDHQKRTLPFLIAYNWALIGIGEPGEARKGVDRALATSRHPQLLLQDGLLRLAVRNYTGGRAVLEEALREKPEDLWALRMVVQSYLAENRRDEAARRIQQQVQQRPGSLDLQMFWARWLLDDQQKVAARKAVDAAAAANPKSAAPLLLAASLDLGERQLAGARTSVQRALKLDDQNVSAYVLAGQVEEASGNSGDAATHYRKAIALDGSNVIALNNLAFVLSHYAASLDEALALARRAKELAPERPEIIDTLGWLYYNKGLYELAAKELEGALAKAPWPVIQFHLGLTYNRLGKTEQGARLLTTALTKDPNLAQVLH